MNHQRAPATNEPVSIIHPLAGRLPFSLEAHGNRLAAIAAIIALFGNGSAQRLPNTDSHRNQSKAAVKLDANHSANKPPVIGELELSKLLERQRVEIENSFEKKVAKALAAQKARDPKGPLQALSEWFVSVTESSPYDVFGFCTLVLGAVGVSAKAYLGFRGHSSDSSCTGHVMTKGEKGVVLLGNIHENDLSRIWDNMFSRKHLRLAETRAKQEPGFPFLRFKTEYGKKILTETRSYVSAVPSDHLSRAAKRAKVGFEKLCKNKKFLSRISLPDCHTIKCKDAVDADDVVIAISYEEQHSTLTRIVQLPMGNVPQILLQMGDWMDTCKTDKGWLLTTIELSLAVMLYPYEKFNRYHPVKVMCKDAPHIWEHCLQTSRDLERVLAIKKADSASLVKLYIRLSASNAIMRDSDTGKILNREFQLSPNEQAQVNKLWSAEPSKWTKLTARLLGRKPPEAKPYYFSKKMFTDAD